MSIRGVAVVDLDMVMRRVCKNFRRAVCGWPIKETCLLLSIILRVLLEYEADLRFCIHVSL